ncbi:DUF2235 domain-containing protein [Dongia deserti]|uniref:DUF2235 domain-containing protein n=1 Tax=Dongia deserti TaxID=2268030 RepID=UPI000E651773|nr:DUF2235 domain-containing protein [Dongia deserti]
MSRNFVIYSDGTGQRGGVLFDERRSNIYKLYRATRCGPDCSVDPKEQYAFYDPGIGTSKGARGLLGTAWDFIYNLICQATGLGLTGNIIDCYAALVRNWRPDDRIFLFGFSRGAYTVRCLGAVIALCGIPTMDGDQPLKRDMKTSKRIAKQAVKRVYQHTHSWEQDEITPRQKEQLDQRRELAERFRAKYRSNSADGSGANVYPHFIGVFDTVAAISNMTLATIVLGIAALAINFSAVLGVAGWFGWDFGWPSLLGISIGVIVALAILGNLLYRVRWEIGLRHSRWWRPFHLLKWRMRFYDKTLNPKVQYARHALAIDERRKDFNRVKWGTPGDNPERPTDGPEWFQQIWFSGCHSDIGGSYLEEESRLSDIPLKWMLEAAESAGLKYDPAVLKLYPDALGMQHDETRGIPFKWFAKIDREIPVDAPLHASVFQRFAAKDVQLYDVFGPYRPEALRRHSATGEFY